VIPIIYLDNHATTPVDPGVVEAMLPFLTERYGNPSSSHALGQDARRAVEEAREQVAALIGARTEDVIFTSGATESDNLAIRGLSRAGRGRHVVVSAIEHPAVLSPCRTLEREGFEVTRVGVDTDGVVGAADVAAVLRPDTVLVSVMAANNEIGTLQPLTEIAQLCRSREIPFHSDAVQALGRVPFDVEVAGVDLASLSAHKMYGPKGVGALYVRRGRRPRLRLAPQSEGGGQEQGVRSGTLNVPGIVGFGAAAALATRALAGGEPERLHGLRERLLSSLRSGLEGITVNGTLQARLPGNLHVSIEGVPAEPLLVSLGDRFALSAGAACSEVGGQGSHVLRALGMTDARVYSSVRFGLGRYNGALDVDAVVAALIDAVRVMRERSSSVRP
jgi:cysteine desulfurase